MKRLLVPLTALILAGGLPSVRAASPAPAGAIPAGSAPDVAKYLATLPAGINSYVPTLPAIVQKNLASMHLLHSLSVDVTNYAPGKTPGTDAPQATYHVDWQWPNKAHLQEYRDGKPASEQLIDGTYRWQWFGGNGKFPPQYMKMDLWPPTLPKNAIVSFPGLGGPADVGPICQPDGLLFSMNTKDLGEVTSPGMATVHRLQLVSGRHGVMNPTTHVVDWADTTMVYDLDPVTGLPLKSTGSDLPTLVYSHYRINPVLPAKSFTVHNPDQYLYYMSQVLPIRPGQPALDFSLSDSEGKPVTLSGLRGQTVLLCFVQPFANDPNSIADPLEQLQHYVDAKAVTVVFVSPFAPATIAANNSFKTQITDWVKAHPFLTKVWFVDTSKGFGEKIRAAVETRYGVSNSSAVLIDRRGTVAAVFTTVFDNGHLVLKSLGKTEAEDKVLKGPSAMDSALAAQITALSMR